MHIDWFRIGRITRGLWFLPALFSVFAVLVVVAAYLSPLAFPGSIASGQLPIQVSSEAIKSILSIVASSILAVTVFALSTLVNLLANVSQTSSPRAVSLFVEDRTAQTSISVFIGAFLFSIVGIIGLSQEAYSTVGRLILFVATLVVVMAIVWALIRWVAQISTVGRVDETTKKVEQATRAALGRLGPEDLARTAAPASGDALEAAAIGFVQHLDRGDLQSLAEEHELFVHVLARPGTYVDFDSTLALVEGNPTAAVLDELREAFFIGHERTFDYDPGFGLAVLAEIAVRALSPGINDPGTAVHVLTVQTRLLGDWAHGNYGERGRGHTDRVTVAPLDPAQLIVEAFDPVIRHAAGSPAVATALLRALRTLASVAPSDFRDIAAQQAREMCARAQSSMGFARDVEAVRDAAADLA